MAIERKPNQQDLSWFIDLYNVGRLELTPPYQRKSVWTPKDRKFFLDTIFSNFPCPAIYLQKENKADGVVYNVVDGKQRLQTIIDFHNNKLRIPASYPEVGLQNKRWKDIEDNPEYRSRFYDYRFTTEQLSSADEGQWDQVFYRVNKSQKGLSEQELRHAKYTGWLVKRAEREVQDPLWHDLKISTLGRARRMKDAEFVSILMLVILEQDIVGFPQSSLDELYAKYDFSDTSTPSGDDEDERDDEFDPSEQDDEVLDEDENQFSMSEDQKTDFEAKLSAAKDSIKAVKNHSDALLRTGKLMTDIFTLWTLIVLHKKEVDSTANFPEIYKVFAERLAIYRKHKKENRVSELDAAKFTQIAAYDLASSAANTELPARRARLAALKEFVLNPNI